MTETIFGNSIILFFAQGAHFLLITILSIILLRQYNVRIKLFLGALLAFWVLLHIKDLIIYDRPENITMEQINWITMIDQMTVPVCGIFQLELIKPRCMNFGRMFLMMLPFVILLIIYSIVPTGLIVSLTFISSAIYSCFIVTYTVIVCRKQPQNSPIRKVGYISIITLVVILVIWILSCLILSTYFDVIYYTISGISWGIIYYAVENICSFKPSENTETHFNAVKKYPFANDLIHLLDNERIYLNSDITITHVARLIGTNRSYLSDYFNHNCNSSFIDYINNLRLCHAENLMKSGNQMSIDEISSSSGFNSLSTFRRAFIKKNGITPSQYRQELSQIKKN